MSMTGLSFVIGRTSVLEESKDYPTHSYYTNLYLQYSFIRDKGEMRFTPPVQTIYATRQAMKEYFEEGEQAKWERHQAVWQKLYEGIEHLGLKTAVPKEYQSHLVIGVLYPDDPNFSFQRLHDILYRKGYTIYPGKVTDLPMFRLCSLGAITPGDIVGFNQALESALTEMGVKLPIR